MRLFHVSLLLVLGNNVFAFWNPGGINCGTLCMNQMNYWGTPQLYGQRPPYIYPYYLPQRPAPPPMNFYNMPNYNMQNPWQMMPRWGMPMGNPGYFGRGVSSEEKDNKTPTSD